MYENGSKPWQDSILAYFKRVNPTNCAKSQAAQQQQQQQTTFLDAQQPTTLLLDATMGNTLSSYPLLPSIDPSFDTRPSSFLECLDSEDGLQWSMYSGYIERRRRSNTKACWRRNDDAAVFEKSLLKKKWWCGGVRESRAATTRITGFWLVGPVPVLDLYLYFVRCVYWWKI